MSASSRRPEPPWDAVWLDAGGVLFANVIEETPFLAALAARWGVDPDELAHNYTAAQPLLEVGRLGLDELWRDAGGPLADAIEEYRRCLRPSAAAWQLAAWVRSLGLPLVLANNEVREWDEVRERDFPSRPPFDHKLTSSAFGAAKPDGRFYAACLELAGSRPERTLYFDDDPDCVAGARALGIAAYLWVDAEEARLRVLAGPMVAGRNPDARP